MVAYPATEVVPLSAIGTLSDSINRVRKDQNSPTLLLRLQLCIVPGACVIEDDSTINDYDDGGCSAVESAVPTYGFVTTELESL